MARISKEQAIKLLEQHKKLQGPSFNLEEIGFSKQIDFIKDTAKLKALFCTRRAAKSFTAGLYLIHEALTVPGCNCLFLGLTRASAKGIIWKDILKELNNTYNLKARFNATELTMTFPNGSVIYVTGADADEDEMNKLLGKKYRLVTIDEASMYTINLHKMVYGILKPAMADLGGTICMMGTASNFTRGLFFDLTNNKEAGWKLYEWSAHDNPHIAKQWQEELDEIDALRPLFKETPLFRQWYLNKWEIDTDKLVYKFNPERNIHKGLAKKTDWVYVLGVDLGWEDDNAFVLTAYNSSEKILYVVDTYHKKHLTFDQVADKIREFMKNPDTPIVKVVIDGANKQGVESMRMRATIPFEYADKHGKVDFIELLNSDLVQGNIKISHSCTDLIQEVSSLTWVTDGDLIRYPKKEHPSLPNHLCDAFLYAWRCGFHYAFVPQPKTPEIGSPEFYRQEEDRMREILLNEVKAQENAFDDPWNLEPGINLDQWKK